MTTGSPTVSVIVPTYNGQAFIAKALQSVFAQSFTPHEIIVVDDCSQDPTLQVVSDLIQRSLAPLRVERLSANSGSPAAPINRGIEMASGELIAVLEQDDVFFTNKLERQASALAHNPSASLVFGLCRRYGTERVGSRSQAAQVVRSLQACGSVVGDGTLLSGDAFLQQMLLHGSVFSGFPGFMFRRSDWQRIGGVASRWRIGGDLNFVCELAKQGDVLFMPEAHYARRFHGSSLSAAGLAAHADLLEIFEAHLAERGGTHDAPRIKKAFHRYVTYAAWYAALGGDLGGGYQLWRLAQAKLGLHARSLPDAAMLLPLRAAALVHPASPTEADVQRIVAAVDRIALKLGSGSRGLTRAKLSQ